MIASGKGVSIIVCCYNSVHRLEKTLQHIVVQKTRPGLLWEVIVIDNASSDSTYETAIHMFTTIFPGHDYLVIKEPKPGLSFARKAGILRAKYPYVVICDDDNWLSETYAQQVFDLFDLNPKIGIIGSKSIGVFENQPPAWFLKIQKAYAVGSQAVKSGEVKSVWGAGIAVRKNVYEELIDLGFEQLNLDRYRDKLYSGGDTELCLAFGKYSYKVWFEENLHLQHFIPGGRLEKSYAEDLFFYTGYAEPLIALIDSNDKGSHWLFIILKSWAVLLAMYLRPASSDYFNDETRSMKKFYIQMQKGKILKLLQLNLSIEHLRQSVQNAKWNKSDISE